MCLAKVYLNHDESQVFTESVVNFTQDGDELTFHSIFDGAKTIKGTVESIDFSDSVINVITK